MATNLSGVLRVYIGEPVYYARKRVSKTLLRYGLSPTDEGGTIISVPFLTIAEGRESSEELTRLGFPSKDQQLMAILGPSIGPAPVELLHI